MTFERSSAATARSGYAAAPTLPAFIDSSRLGRRRGCGRYDRGQGGLTRGLADAGLRASRRGVGTEGVISHLTIPFEVGRIELLAGRGTRDAIVSVYGDATGSATP